MESAAKNVTELTTRPDRTVPPAPVHHVTEATKLASVCYRCEKLGPYAPTCKHKQTVCSSVVKFDTCRKSVAARELACLKLQTQALQALQSSLPSANQFTLFLSKELMSMNY